MEYSEKKRTSLITVSRAPKLHLVTATTPTFQPEPIT
jgi:hypothetical protein